MLQKLRYKTLFFGDERAFKYSEFYLYRLFRIAVD